MNYQDNLIQKSFDIWRQFGESYSKNMIALYEKNLEQSKSFQGQMQKVVNQVITNNHELMVESVKTLETQTADFVNSWDELVEAETE